MSDMIVIEGLAEAKRKLAQLTDAEMKKAEQSGLRAGAQVVAREAKRRAPRKTGRLATKGIGVRTSVRVQVLGNKAEAQVGINRIGRLQETGSKPHTIKAKRGRVLRSKTGAFLGKSIRHPGNVARPFLRPAMEASKGEVTKEYGKAFMKRVDRLTSNG